MSRPYVLPYALPHALPHALPQCPHCTNLNRSRRSSDLLPVDHFLRESRDPLSPIVCPELKSTQCQLCFVLGHTRSHCPSQIKSWRSYATQNKVYEKPNILDKKLDKHELSVNKFSVLLEDESDSDSDSSDPIYNRDGTFRPRSPDYPPPDWIE
jgi:hypothetical protein